MTTTTHEKGIVIRRITITTKITKTTTTITIRNEITTTTPTITTAMAIIETIQTTTITIATITTTIEIKIVLKTGIKTTETTPTTTTTTIPMESLVLHEVFVVRQINTAIIVKRGITPVKIASEKDKITKIKRHLKTKWVGLHIIVIVPQTDSNIQGMMLIKLFLK